MKFCPLHDRVVVRRLDAEEKSKGGFIITDAVRKKPQEGEVVAVGPGARDHKMLFGKWSGTEVKIDALDLLIMMEGMIAVASKSNSASPMGGGGMDF